MTRGLRRRVLLAGAAVALSGLTACSAASQAAAPTWTPAPSFSGEGYEPGGQPTAPTEPGSPPQPGTPSPSNPSTPAQQGDPAVVATKLTAPTGLAILPDNTALVGERTTGRILRVQPVAGRPAQLVRTLTGLNTSGGGGLLDLALSPNYAQDDLIFAYISTRTDNRVVDFTLHGPMTTVLAGIPHGRSDNTGRIAFDSKGNLLIATGDAGHPAWAADPNSLAGKVLRVSDIGRPVPGNPRSGSAVFASGFREGDGLCVSASGNQVLQTEAMSTSPSDPVNLVTSGSRFAWPVSGSDAGALASPLAHLPRTARSPGGCAVADGVLYTTSLDGQELLAARLSTSSKGGVSLSAFKATLHKKYGRLRTVVAAPDGALWLTTSNRDGRGKPIPTDERVIRVVPSGNGGSQSNV